MWIIPAVQLGTCPEGNDFTALIEYTVLYLSMVGRGNAHRTGIVISVLASTHAIAMDHADQAMRRWWRWLNPQILLHQQRGANTDTQLQILAAIQSLARRMDRVEARHSFSPSLPPGQEGVPPPAQQGNPDTDTEDADVLSLRAPHSLADNAQQAEGGSQGEGPHSDSAEVDGESTGRDDFSTNALVARVFSAAKILCLQPSVPDPAPVGGVWEGIPQTNSPSCIPVADDYTSMLRTTWKKPSQKPQFNAGCRRLANARYPKETGLGDMPPVEQEIASWTTLGPAYTSANPRCPRKECAKTDRLISRSFNTRSAEA
ncbi:hypothetical protein DPEC_G00039980 [Dallia pectoralis]|uniref:Uncharacterized protein n=1 Tax=Dallia pectoralis TaxID=75939 RepID=A0ACC2HFD8_DALPE|nr:hypothetical protein DPEC_G00039980 [Dallia pectoralis]